MEIKFSGTIQQVHEEIRNFVRALDSKEVKVKATTEGKRYSVPIPVEESPDIDIPITFKSDELPSAGGALPKTNGPQNRGQRDCQFCGQSFMRAGKHEPHCSSNSNRRPAKSPWPKKNDRLPDMDPDMEDLPF